MRVAVLGSGSRGNAILIRSGDMAMLVDAGFGVRTLARRARAGDVDLRRLDAVVLTHEHGDHARGAAATALRAACPLYASPGTLAALGSRLDGVSARPLASHTATPIGSLVVESCRTSHDAAEPLALAVTVLQSGQRVGIAYDLGRPTAQVRYLLRASTALVLEANHDDVLLRTGPYPARVCQRIAGPGGHLSNREAAQLAAELHHPGLQTVVLAHLSDRCNRPELALAVVRRALAGRGYRGRLLVAAQNEPLPPFALATQQYAFGLD
jgi:phosphoribosyl 1,2-cyclic phosphodiesterase